MAWLQHWSNWSRCARMRSSWMARSRSKAAAGKDGLSTTSAKTSRPVFKSLLKTSAVTPKLLLPPKVSMLPPTDSMARAICSALRRRVPWSNIFETNWVRPLLEADSARTPPWKTARNSTNGRRWSSLTSKRRPLGKTILRTADSQVTAKSSAGLGAAPAGRSAYKVRLAGVKYSRAARCRTAGVTRRTAAR